MDNKLSPRITAIQHSTKTAKKIYNQTKNKRLKYHGKRTNKQ